MLILIHPCQAKALSDGRQSQTLSLLAAMMRDRQRHVPEFDTVLVA